MNILPLIGSITALIGSVFLFLGALGVLRMPDLYNRMQAGTKATTLGSILMLLGIGLYHPTWLSQMILLILFIAITNPLSSHALARAAHFAGIPLTKKTVHDELQMDEHENPDEETQQIMEEELV
ncbi:MAG TPA: monovalent cation/H(+) antiporter subunit G [Balneolales bacterium]|jgi:multicomponent Na+:H+ antiporter subunit G|nr:monovalent cation/H(+) antiporter subunit G [Balneolales bacterium]